jgi:DNA-binding MarR family transcriptional regulator
MKSDTPRAAPAVLNTASQLCGLLHATNAKLIGPWDRVLRQYGLDFAGYAALLALYERSPISEGDLSLRLQFDPFTFEDALADLERCRLISRSGSTEAGDRLVAPSGKAFDLQPDLLDIAGRLANDFSFAEADAQQLMGQLRRLSLAITNTALDHLDVTREHA